jgi:hypothetical protein
LIFESTNVPLKSCSYEYLAWKWKRGYPGRLFGVTAKKSQEQKTHFFRVNQIVPEATKVEFRIEALPEQRKVA